MKRGQYFWMTGRENGAGSDRCSFEDRILPAQVWWPPSYVKAFAGSLGLCNKPRLTQNALLKLTFTSAPSHPDHILPIPQYKTWWLFSLICPPPHSIITLSSYQPHFKSCTKANSSSNSPQCFNWPNVINVMVLRLWQAVPLELDSIRMWVHVPGLAIAHCKCWVTYLSIAT